MTRVVGRRWFAFKNRAVYEHKKWANELVDFHVSLAPALIGWFVEVHEPVVRDIELTGDLPPRPVYARALTDDEVKDIWA